MPMSTARTACSDYQRKFYEKGEPVYALWVEKPA